MQIERFYPSSLSLPQASQDYEGLIFEVGELGTDTVALWYASGGDSWVWTPVTPSYVGPAAGLPDPTRLRVGAMAVIDQPRASGGTRPPAQASSGAKMKRLHLRIGLSHDGLNQVWQVVSAQNLFSFVGIPTSPVTAAYTLTVSTGEVICEFGLIPAGLLAFLIGCELTFELLFGRGTGAIGTATAAVALSATSGTPGTVISNASLTANANSTCWLEGRMMVAASGTELITYALNPGGNGAFKPNLPIALDLTTNFVLQAIILGAIGQDFTLLSARVDIR